MMAPSIFARCSAEQLVNRLCQREEVVALTPHAAALLRMLFRSSNVPAKVSQRSLLRKRARGGERLIGRRRRRVLLRTIQLGAIVVKRNRSKSPRRHFAVGRAEEAVTRNGVVRFRTCSRLAPLRTATPVVSFGRDCPGADAAERSIERFARRCFPRSDGSSGRDLNPSSPQP